jgi:hypothetical protein
MVHTDIYYVTFKAFMPLHGHGNSEPTFLEDFNWDKSKESHTDGVYKGLGCLIGMYVFFIIEKLVQMNQITKEEVTIKKLNLLMKNEYVSSSRFISFIICQTN